MTARETYRDVISHDKPTSCDAGEGRAYIAVVGIDHYRTWDRLYNAVSDAKGALALFTRLGFELVGPSLFDENATGDALRRLVIDDLSVLGGEDSLVLFFAGHGHTITRTYGGTSVKDGYLIPTDGDPPGGRAGAWIRLESWLTEITRIPAKHILVILDACHSGIALGPILQWRSRGMENGRREPFDQLRARRSRRIITSALDNQLAMDGGPVPGHSLFTGCLLEAMTGGLVATSGHSIVTGSEIGYYVQRRVSEYPRSAQTPDFGALELDDRGELLIDIARQSASTGEALTGPVARTAATARDERYTPGAERTYDGFGGATRPSSPRRMRPLRLWLGGGLLIVSCCGIAALMTMRSKGSESSVGSAPTRTSDAAEGAKGLTAPEERQLPQCATQAGSGERCTRANTNDRTITPDSFEAPSKELQQPSRETDDANSMVLDMPPIDDRGN